MTMPLLDIRNLSFGRVPHTPILQHVDLCIQPNTITSIMGASGIGKSTFLDLLAGLLTPSSGEILFEGQVVSDTPDHLDLHTRHNVGIIFQNYGLFPRLTVEAHIDFGLLNTGKVAEEKNLIIENVLQKIGLDRYRQYYPHQLSGGMQQRLAVGSILANDSPCLLMDEPFSAVDIVTRQQMQDFLLEIQKQYKKTIILVTHQVDEALLLSDRILLFDGHPAKIGKEILITDEKPRDLHSTSLLLHRKEIYEYIGREKEAGGLVVRNL